MQMKISTNCSSLVILGDFSPFLFFCIQNKNLPRRNLGTLWSKQIINTSYIRDKGYRYTMISDKHFQMTFYSICLSCGSELCLRCLVSRFSRPHETPCKSVLCKMHSSNLDRNPPLYINEKSPVAPALSCLFNVNKSTRLPRFWAESKLNLLGMRELGQRWGWASCTCWGWGSWGSGEAEPHVHAPVCCRCSQ